MNNPASAFLRFELRRAWNFYAPAIGLLIAIQGYLVSSTAAREAEARPNVLFVAIDDLRPDLGAYQLTAAEQMGGARLPVLTPFMDRIAHKGVVFEQAYCQQAVCGPSRISLLTGTYPDRFGIYGMSKPLDWRKLHPELYSLPQVFRNEGWQAVGFGKIFDDRLGLDRGHSWDEFDEDWRSMFADPANQKLERSGKKPAVECVDVADEFYTDGHIAKLALDFLGRRDSGKPFFLAVGFTKPHLPFVAPKKYWDLYDRNKLPTASVVFPPAGNTEYTLSPYKEIFDYGVHNPIPEAQAREMVHGYLACISYVDTQIGKLLVGLKQQGLLDNTIVVIWGDNGFKLGDYGEWAKATNLEVDTRVPLIIQLPDKMVSARGAHSKSLVEFVDVFPTLCAAAGLPVPSTVQGTSLMPLLLDPTKSVRQSALSQYPREGVMGYSLRTVQWRFTEWRTQNGTVKARELYDLDATHNESKNVADMYPEVIQQLDEMLTSYPITWK